VTAVPVDVFTAWVFPSLLLSLRIAPVFAFAPPFTLVPAPAPFRLLFGLGVAATLVWSHPAAAALADPGLATVVAVAVRELLLGSIFVLAFQLAFGALAMAGRTIDIQAGFGLAVLIDPTTKTQTPLIGTLFSYAAGVIFFALGGHIDLLRIFTASLEAIPLGAAQMPGSLARLTGFISVVFLTSFGVAGGVILSLFLADLAVAGLSRTAPQMNVLVLGFQVKTILLLMVLPMTFGFAGALLARVTSLTLEALPGLL
jgi:flagellar biosynthetic protein FliR